MNEKHAHQVLAAYRLHREAKDRLARMAEAVNEPPELDELADAIRGYDLTLLGFQEAVRLAVVSERPGAVA